MKHDSEEDLFESFERAMSVRKESPCSSQPVASSHGIHG